MKVFFNISLLLLLALLFTSCSSNSPNQTLDNSSGQIALRFEKSTIPENVVSVKATLSKDSHEPIISSFSLLDSNSAELFIDQIPVGQWNLIVEAFDFQNLVVFSGETILNIVAGEITTVSLTLAPTGNGTGSIYIIVNWGDGNKFIDFPQNPIMTKQSIGNEYYGVRGPYVLKVDDTYYMWYFTQSDHGKMYINLATSSNGLNWAYCPSNPVISPGEYGSWDDLRVAMPTIIYDDNMFKMYYQGFRDAYGQWSVGLATSVDGINWEKYPNPVLSGSMLNNDFKITPNAIIKIDGIFYLYYGAKNYTYDYKNCIATSSDGVNWTKMGELVFNTNQGWEADAIAITSVQKYSDSFQMIYASADENGVTGFGEAFSQDGINWIKHFNNPVFTKERAINDYWQVSDPFLFKDDNELRIYYGGWIGDVASINVARKFIY
jgi:predicted GH43/DUF377 family glycosyl hydrolase